MSGTKMQVRHMLYFIEMWESGAGNYYSECAGLMLDVEKDASLLDDPVWLYAYDDYLVFTNVEGDITGAEGSSYTAALANGK